jgi:hypothetical protein
VSKAAKIIMSVLGVLLLASAAAGLHLAWPKHTTTVRYVAAKATPVEVKPKPKPAATRTVTAEPRSAPAPAAASAADTECESGVAVNANTSCPFAENVQVAYANSGLDGTSGDVSAYSPVTGETYTMYCAPTGGIDGSMDCTTPGANNLVWLSAGAQQTGGSQQTAPVASSGQFDNVSAITESVTAEQQAALAAAPASDYDSSDDAPVTITITSDGGNNYTASASDSDGDVGGGDQITVSPDGSSWSDNGMGWSGPDIGGSGFWITPAVSDWSS